VTDNKNNEFSFKNPPGDNGSNISELVLQIVILNSAGESKMAELRVYRIIYRAAGST